MGLCDLPEFAGFNVGCVTAKYYAEQASVFAPVIGEDRTGRVSWEASAAWGVASSGNPVPFELDQVELDQQQCLTEVPEGTPETECAFYFNNETTPASTWDFIDLSQWDVEPDASCASVGTGTVTDWIDGSVLVDVGLETIPTYVCRATGMRPPVWRALEEQVGKIKVFPINDPAQEILGSHRKYAIVGWAPMRVVAVLSGEAAYGSGVQNCEDDTWDFSPSSTLDVRLLVGHGSHPCPAGQTPDQMTAPVISKEIDRNTTVYVEGPAGGPNVDYTWDPDTYTVTWHRDESVQDVKITFDWALAGRCGVHEPDPNARCVVLSYPGPQVGGTGVCTANCQDFGLRAVVLVR
jgi:hypothetical protein